MPVSSLMALLVLAQPIPGPGVNCAINGAQCVSKKFVMKAGGSVCLNPSSCTSTLTVNPTGTGWAMMSSALNANTNVAYSFDTLLAMTGNTFLLNVSNAGVSEFSVDDGGGVIAQGGLTTPGNVLADNFESFPSTAPVSLLAAVVDSASSVGTVINQSPALATNGAKLVSIQNNGAETNSFTWRGSLGMPMADISASPGGGTINAPCGIAAFPALNILSVPIVIANNVAKAGIPCLATMQTVDLTARGATCVVSNGSLSLYPSAGTTGITKVAFLLFNGN